MTDFPVKMEIDRHVQKKDAIKRIRAVEWVCCMDCGLLIEKRKHSKPQWSVCPACVRVYSEVQHSWLAEMLAKRMAQSKDVLEKNEAALKENRVYFCGDCGRFYLKLSGDDTVSHQCRWCFLMDKKTGSRLKARREGVCLICYRETGGQPVCSDCVNKMRLVRKSVEYVYYVTWLGRFMREPAQESGKVRTLAKLKRLRQGDEKIK
jgi:hypothetical protein